MLVSERIGRVVTGVLLLQDVVIIGVIVVLSRLAGGAAFYWEWQGQGKHARCVHHWANFGQMDARYVWDDQGSVTVVNADGTSYVIAVTVS